MLQNAIKFRGPFNGNTLSGTKGEALFKIDCKYPCILWSVMRK